MADSAKGPTVRLSDVAKRAHCSAATVSRVLNAPESVNRDARLRVEAAVAELGYTRNAAARALRSRRSQVVGVILPTLKHPIYADFIDSLQNTLAQRGYLLIVATSEYCPDRELAQARLLVERGIDGLVLVGQTRRPDLYALIAAQELPYVTTYTYRPEFDHPVVGFDNFTAMAQVVDHLVGLGHRDFAMLAGGRDSNDRIAERVAGAVAALDAHGLPLPPGRIVDEAFTIQGGRRGLRRLAATGQCPTALLCTSDLLAYGALIEARALDIAVPGRLSVVGFDDLPPSADLVPALSTLAIPAEEMGRRAGDYLVALFAGRRPPAQLLIATHLVLRDTTAPPPGRPEAAGARTPGCTAARP